MNHHHNTPCPSPGMHTAWCQLCGTYKETEDSGPALKSLLSSWSPARRAYKIRLYHSPPENPRMICCCPQGGKSKHVAPPPLSFSLISLLSAGSPRHSGFLNSSQAPRTFWPQALSTYRSLFLKLSSSPWASFISCLFHTLHINQNALE